MSHKFGKWKTSPLGMPEVKNVRVTKADWNRIISLFGIRKPKATPSVIRQLPSRRSVNKLAQKG